MTLRFPVRFVSTLFACALAAMLTTPVIQADTVVLKNGDQLTGTAVKLEGGKLTFKTAYADAVTIAWDQVKSLTTSQPFILPTPEGNLSVTSVERTPTGFVLTTASGPAAMDSAAVTVLRSPADQKTYEDSLHPGWGHAWAGAANLSLALSKGNSDNLNLGAGLTAARATTTDKTSLYANTLYSRDSHADLTTANATGGGLRYDHNLKPRLFAFGSGDFSANALQNLDLRSIMGGGFGWHAQISPRQTFDVLGGLVWTHESYSGTAATLTTPATPSVVNSFAALDVGEQFTRKVGSSSLLTEQASFYPDLSDMNQYQFTITSAFSTKIGKMFNWVTTFSDNYTSFPPAGTLDNDVILTTGLGVSLTRH
jgi:putative salt-induced outer membrane protein YdiY